MVKQVILVRKDLKMRRGKEISQGSHSSIAFLSRRIRAAFGLTGGPGFDDDFIQMDNVDFDPITGKVTIQLKPAEIDWIKGPFKKICLQVESEAELREYHQKALDAGLESHLIIDSGLTEFGGVPTPTCCAIGPDDPAKIDAITAKLKLY